MSSEELNWKILFIDDEEGIRKVIKLTLSDAGYDVVTAANGKQGMEICAKENPQIVITDIRMPEMNGIEVLKKIKEDFPDMEVIMVTGFGDMDLVSQALTLNASDFINKPIHDEALMVALDRAKKKYLARKNLYDYTALMEDRWVTTADALEKIYNFQNNLIESSIDGIIGCDEEGKIRTFNRAMEEMLGHEKDEVIGKMTLKHLLPVREEEKFQSELYSDDFGGKNRLIFVEKELLTKAGNKIPVQLSATVIFERGEAAGLVAIFRDLRELRRLEQQFADHTRLLQQDKMISLGRLSASVVHEINNPLAGILNYARLMMKIMGRGPLTPEYQDKFQRYLTLIESETSRCSKIVSNLLAFSRKSELKFSEIDVNELLQKCLLLSQHKMELQKIEPELELDESRPKIWGDFNQIQQAVINLVFNAIDAMPDGGRLSIASVSRTADRYTEIKVKDTGCGIPPESIDRIFDPFYTTKREGQGIGLGLSTVYGIIDRHKGKIEVASEPNKGTVFTLTFPVTPKPD